MERHLKALGILNIVWGSLGVLGATILLMIFGGAVGLIGAFANGDPGAVRVAIPLLSAIGGFLVLLILATSAPSVVLGIGLLRMSGWARVLGIVVSALHLLSIPFGTALGIYGLWVLLSPRTEALFAPSRRIEFPARG
jgi:hypothetical protein